MCLCVYCIVMISYLNRIFKHIICTRIVINITKSRNINIFLIRICFVHSRCLHSHSYWQWATVVYCRCMCDIYVYLLTKKKNVIYDIFLSRSSCIHSIKQKQNTIQIELTRTRNKSIHFVCISVFIL